MGLDIVDLLMQCEDVFGIEIPNGNAAKVRTVGDLYYTVQDAALLATQTIGSVTIPDDAQELLT